MPKLHLKCSDTPIQLGKDTVADCGETVKSAYAAYFVDGKYFSSYFGIPPTGTCHKCLKTLWDQTARYIYALVNGEESMRQESRDAGS